jgi:hypothetical protein
MGEFYLPDRIRDLAVVERRLRRETLAREAEYNLVRINLPAGVSAVNTPAFFTLLVAHRRWQFAYEKLDLLRRARARDRHHDSQKAL